MGKFVVTHVTRNDGPFGEVHSLLSDVLVET